MRVPIASRVVAALVLFVGMFAGAATESAAASSADPRVVFVLRHAEKVDDEGRDPDLSEVGHRRAEALAAMLSSAGVTHLFATEYKRTQQTLGPLSAVLDLEAVAWSAGDTAGQAAQLRKLPPGSVAVVSGHSNTVPELIEALGGKSFEIGHEQYDRLFVVFLPLDDGAIRVVELQFAP